ncbi:glycosyltransferase family 39 protein [Bradyrhizobium prioriisuperbiae]|uniref:glycosyltransferase family 39 protein n=1 Tax=Bradyrhizobium prioriisuperbiae TaxID=2854389 RepID=UPI0028E3FE22|nr:glycosyltransferase family 39 protein [Bradyrhizobium prioritasuperba]
MRFTSLIVELVRARPKLIFWIVVLAQAALWFVLPMLLYRSPPGEIATLLAFGREYQVGTDLGPPLAFWLADIAYRFTGNHIFGVYLLAQVCFIVTMWALFELGGAIVGRQQAVLVVMITAAITVFSFPGVEFGPAVLARPLWALVLLHAYRVIGQGRRNAWFALSIESGLLLLTSHVGVLLLLLLFGFMLATVQGRRALRSVDPWFAVVVVAVLVLPYLIWLVRSHALQWPALPPLQEIRPRALRWGELLALLVLSMSGIALLVIFNSRRLARDSDSAPVIFRPPVAPFARRFVLFFALAPALVTTLLSALFGFGDIIGGAGIVVLMTGLAVIVLSGDLIPVRRQETLRTIWAALILAPAAAVLAMTLIQPWTSAGEVKTSLPASEIGRFFGESFERRTGQRLQAVAGDPQLSSLIGFGTLRHPHVFFDAAPQLTPWLTLDKFNETGGIVVWRAADTAGTPPEDIARRFPGLAPEVPRAFERMVTGRQPLLRIGWAIVRPRSS